MPVARVFGAQLLTETEFEQNADLIRKMRHDLAAAPLSIGGRTFAPAAMNAWDDSLGATNGWKPTPITPGGPLTIKILHVYTGKYPKDQWLTKSGMAVFSSVKDEYVYKGAARAINYLSKDIKKKKHYKLAAYQDGTDIVAYVPGLASSTMTVTLQMAFDDFPDALFDKVAAAAGDLAKVPILAPNAGFLMLASKLVNLGGDLLNGADSQAELEHTETLNFDIINGPVTQADIRIIYKFPIDVNLYEFDWNKGLVRKSDKEPYNEDGPYFILLIDGAKRDQLKTFAPTVASASVLKNFLNVRPNGDTPLLDTMIGLVKLDNDYQFYKRALRVRDELKDPTLSTEDKARLKQQYNALVKNIGADPDSPFKLEQMS